MNRSVYIQDETIALCEYIRGADDRGMYDCWQDVDTKKGYNFAMEMSFDQFCVRKIRNRLLCTIIRIGDDVPVGQLFLSPEGSPPDLAIMLYPQFHGQGYGSRAFRLGVEYCFETFDLDEIYAGCFDGNIASARMLSKLGFERHPQGDQVEKSIFTGEDIVQRDYVLKHSKYIKEE